MHARDILSRYICIPRHKHESRPGARKGGCTVLVPLFPSPFSYVHTRVQGQVVWRGSRMGARMGVLQAAVAWIRQCIGTKKKKESARDGEGIDGEGKGEDTRGSTSSLFGSARLEGIRS